MLASGSAGTWAEGCSGPDVKCFSDSGFSV